MRVSGVDLSRICAAGLARLQAHPFAQAAAKHFSTRAALTALLFLFLATSGIAQMEAACRKSVVTQGRYSLVETNLRHWRAPDLRVGWKKADAYIGSADYTLLATLAALRTSLSYLMYLTPLAWLAAFRLREQMQTEDSEENAPASEVSEMPGDRLLAPPLAE